MITAEKLVKFAPQIVDPEIHAAALEKMRRESSIKSIYRLAHFMGQIYVETAKFTSFVENLNYRDPVRLDALFSAVKGLEHAKTLIEQGPIAIANTIYGNRLGNGPPESGDGWSYRGSGYIQLTGKDNYFRMAERIGLPLVKDPELARIPETAADIAITYWDLNRLSELADLGDLDGITKAINGPQRVGIMERRKAVAKALDIWRAP